MFPLFSHLPIELRLQIWETALPSTGVLEIKEKLVRKSSCDQGARSKSGATSSRHPYRDVTRETRIVHTSKLFANIESHQAAVQYDLRTAAIRGSSLEASLDFDADTIYLRFNLGRKFETDDWLDDMMQKLETLAQSEDFAHVRKLAVLLQLDGISETCHSQLSRIWRWFIHLGDFRVVVKHFDEGIGEKAVVVYVEPKRSRAEPMWGTRAPDILVAMIFVLSLELERIVH